MYKKLQKYNSVHALLIYNNKFLLQKRDNIKNIHFPDFWGLFGGKVKKNELPKKAIIRELEEEINISHFVFLKNIFNLIIKSKDVGPERDIKYFFIILKNIPNKVKIFEGSGFDFFTFNQLKFLKIHPFDYAVISFYYFKYMKKLFLIPSKYLK
jgi:8-oxo-dGTP diphosphatase